MKKILLLIILWSSTVAFSQTKIDYQGNGKIKFGGAIGKGLLTYRKHLIRYLCITRGTGLFDSLVVFYIDILAGNIHTQGSRQQL